MKFSLLSVAAMASTGASHAIMQKISVNGQDQGQLKGVRAPSSDYPLQNVNDGSFACNTGIQYKDNNVISIPAGAKVGAWWGHVIGGPQSANDPDHPIAKSHKGPIQYYMAKVDNAASTGTTGLKWFKVAHDGLSGGQWAVDRMISGGGWHYFTMPSCLANGDYLLRVELLALHSASQSGQAQFYMECAQVRISGGGSYTGGSTVSFPGAYTSNHPGIQLSIYGNSGQPDNGGRSYSIPGPEPMSCSGQASGSGSSDGSSGGSNTGGSSGGSSGSAGSAALYGQCGGIGWTGPTTCASGSCKVSSEYYSQCL